MRSAPVSPPPLPFSVHAPPYSPPGYPPPPPPPSPSHGGYFDGNYSVMPLQSLLQTNLYDNGSTYFFQVICFSAVAYHLGWALVHKYMPDLGPKVRFGLGRTFRDAAQQFRY